MIKTYTFAQFVRLFQDAPLSSNAFHSFPDLFEDAHNLIFAFSVYALWAFGFKYAVRSKVLLNKPVQVSLTESNL